MIYQRFNNFLPTNPVALDEASSFEMSLKACQTTRCHNRENYNPQPNKSTSDVILPKRCQICVRVCVWKRFSVPVWGDWGLCLNSGFGNKGVEPSGSIFIHSKWRRHISVEMFTVTVAGTSYSSTKIYSVKVKVKQSHYRNWQALRVPGGWDFQILRQSVQGGGKVFSPRHRPPLPPGNILISVRGWVDPRAIVRPEGLCQWKIPVT
jgi:hypothetical protein